MKKIKNVVALLLCLVLAFGVLTACSDSSQGGENLPAASNDKNDATVENENDTQNNEENDSSDASDSGIASDVEATLRLYGPGLFTSVTETGAVDVVTGIEKPGYEVVVKRWNELYPNVKLEIETIPWDNWKAALQTAALSGEVDILIHGASITAICEPVDKYLEKEPELRDLVCMLPMRRNEEYADFSEYIPYGLTIVVNPVLAVLDKQILENHGVDIPDASWTFEDLKEIAAKTTGIDPVTGEQTYGISMIEAGSANKNYIWVSRGFNAEVFEFGKTVKDTKADVTKQATKDVLNYITELYQYSSPDYLEGLDKSVAYTEENNLAIVITETAYEVYNQIKVAGLEDRFMFLPLPQIIDGQHKGITASHMGDWNMAIAKTSPNKDLAWEFMKFMVTDEKVQEWLVETYSIPANKSGLDSLKEAMHPEYYEAIANIVETAPLEFSASTNTCYDSSNFATFATDITSVLNEMFVGNMDADEAVVILQKTLDDFLK